MTLESGECTTLGSRLRGIDEAIASLVNIEFDFVIGDWVLEGSYYVIDVTTTKHGSGELPMYQIYEKIGLEYHSVSLDSIILQSNGDFKIRVLADPDLRFNGRLIVDE